MSLRSRTTEMNDHISGLLLEGGAYPMRWNLAGPLGTPVAVTYSFMETAPAGAPGFRTASDSERANARLAFAAWAAVCGVSFVEVPDSGNGGDIRLGLHSFAGTEHSEAAGYTSMSWIMSGGGPEILSNSGDGDILLNTESGSDGYYDPGNYGFSTLLHEIGHALGLEHPTEGTNQLAASEDNTEHTVMSYNKTVLPTTPGPYDIEAVRYFYGSDDGAVRYATPGTRPPGQ